MARLSSGLFVAAWLRRCAVEGAFAVVQKKGAAEGGSIFVTVEAREGTALYGPAPQSAYDERPEDRLFVLLVAAAAGSGETVARRLDREMRFDPDLWILAVEDREGRHFLNLADA